MSNDANALKRKEQIKKILVYGGMVMLCLVSFYFIFKPSKEQVQAEQQKVGFNAELPDPRGAGIEADKIAAYELEDMRVKQEQKMRTLEDFTAMTTDDEEEEVVEIPEEPRYTGGGSSYRSGSSSRSNSFSTSTSAYNDINATLGSFYEEPREDLEKEALKAELEELKQSMAQQQNSQPTYADQVALLEKSYELAAKYMPGGTAATSEGTAEEVETTTRSGKAKAQPVGHVTTPVVSALAQPVSDSMMIARMAQSVGGGFHTAVGEAPKQTARNTIKACVHGDQTITSVHYHKILISCTIYSPYRHHLHHLDTHWYWHLPKPESQFFLNRKHHKHIHLHRVAPLLWPCHHRVPLHDLPASHGYCPRVRHRIVLPLRVLIYLQGSSISPRSVYKHLRR